MQTNRSSGLKSFIGRIDFVLLLPSLLLVVISLSTLFSISPVFFRQQLVSLLISVIAFIIFSRLDLNLFSYLSRYLYIAIIFLLVAVLIIGVEVNGAKSWFSIFGIRLQISEIAKPFFLIIMATFLSSVFTARLYRFLGALVIVIPVFFLIAIQPDLGTGIIFAASSLMIIFLSGFPKRYIFSVILAGVLSFPAFVHFLQDYQKQRLFTFLDITRDPSGASYNAIQSLISIGSGGFFGKGFGQGTQSLLRFLPEQHTDFIFATISEDLGFIGSLTVLSLFVLILYRIYKIASSTENKYQYLLAMGVFALFFFQLLFNVGMNLGLMPIIGITLPFVSYGGSSLLSSFIALGIASNISTESKKVYSMEIV